MYDAIYNKKKQITHSWLILNKEEKMCNQNKSKNEPATKNKNYLHKKQNSKLQI